MVWTGRATRSIRESLETEIELADLRRAWGPLDLENHAHGLARPGLDLQLVLARRDKVVLPELSQRFIRRLKDAGARPDILELNCGYYSLAMRLILIGSEATAVAAATNPASENPVKRTMLELRVALGRGTGKGPGGRHNAAR
jgi:hypothetical protein